MSYPSLTENPNTLHPWAKLETFCTDTPHLNLDVIHNLLLTDFENTDTLLILHTSGNGGSHLLHGLGNKLSGMKKNIYCITAGRLVNEYEKGNSWLLKDIMASRYLLVDGFHHTNHLPKFRAWFQASVQRRALEGKKVVLACGIEGLQDSFLPAISAGLGRVEKVYAHRPPDTCREKIIRNLFNQGGMAASPAVIKTLLSMDSPSAGHLKVLTKFVMVQALEKKKDLSKMTERQFLFQFNKQLKWLAPAP